MILLTGATGFVGKDFLRYLESISYDKNEIVILSSREIQGYTTILHQDYSYAKEKLQKYTFDCVIHLGAVTPKGFGEETVKKYLQNIRTTQYLVDNLPNIPKRFIYASSEAVYKKEENRVITEESELTNDDVYGITKILCEKYLEEWSSVNNVDLQILRFGHVYGPGEETYAKIVGTFIEKAQKNETIEIYDGGKQNRNMIYVRDLSKCIYYSLICKEKIGIVNLVSNNNISVKELAEIVIEEIGSTSIIDSKRTTKQIRSDNFSADKFWKIYGHYLKKETLYRDGIVNLIKYLKIESDNKSF